MRKIKFLLILFVVISTMYLVNTTKSRYVSEINITNDVDVAVPQIVLDTTNTMMNNTILPGNSTTCEFYVRNHEDSNINEVSMRYYISCDIISQEIPLTYKIYEVFGTQEIELSKQTEGFGPITLDYETQEDKCFKIVFTWNESDNDVSYAEKEFNFQISINATQVV